MNQTFPVTLKTYSNGQTGVFFVDVPEATTCGDTLAEALDLAQDALVVALSCYLDDGRKLPTASKPERGQPVVAVPPRAAIKLAIHEAMRTQGITQAQLAERLCIDGRQVRRVLDLDHESKLSALEAALAALGLRAEISVSKVAPVDSSLAVWPV